MMSDQYSIVPHASSTLVFACDENSIWGNLFGPITKPVCVGREANSFRLLFIVEFQPAGYYAFSGMPQKELSDIELSFEQVNPVLYRLIAQRLETSANIDSFVADVDQLLMAHLKISYYQQEFSLTNRMIVESSGLLSVKTLSQNVFYSERHLNRMFDKYMGVSVKSFSRLVRVNKALSLLQRPSLSIMQVCLQTGFYDIPHFIRDFKSICGITPQEYRNNMSDFYSEIAKF